MDDSQNTNQDASQNQAQSRDAGRSDSDESSDSKRSHPSGPANPVSGSHKEVAPLSGQANEYVKPVESAPELPKEVAEVGVQTVEDRPEIHPEAAKAGVTHAKEHVTHPTEPPGVVS